jgi:3-phenylpropionate/trans-cinnamate dioxygenase ferredoxin subunit
VVLWVTVATTDEIPDREPFQVIIDDVPICVCNLDGEFFAISDVCTHEDYYLSGGAIEGDEIECPRHATVFNIRTGAVEVPPATKPLPTFACRVVGDEVQVGIDT